MFTEMILPSIFVGTPMAHFSLDTNLTMSGYATESIVISLNNIVPISVFEILLRDMPDGLLVTAVNPTGRFADAGGLLLDNSGEDADGNCFHFWLHRWVSYPIRFWSCFRTKCAAEELFWWSPWFVF